MEIIVLGIVAGLSLLSYTLWKRTRGERPSDTLPDRRPARRLTSGEPDIHALRPGDIVTHVTTDYLIEGVLTLDDDGRVMRLYKMADGVRVRWLAARPGDDELLFLDEVMGLPIEINAPDELSHGGEPYRLSARSTARAGTSGSVGVRATPERVGLFEYSGIGARRIIAIAWPDHAAAFEGEPIRRGMLEILQAT